MSKHIAKAIRILTVAPVMALVAFSILYVADAGVFSNAVHYIISLICLCVLPLIAYPVAYIVSALHQMGRRGERMLAMCFSVAGYIIGMIFAYVSDGTVREKALFGAYLLTGVFLLLAALLFRQKPSGHGAGVAGPVTMLVLWVSPWFLFGYLLLVPVFHASIAAKRHTPLQLIIGTVAPVIALLLWLAIAH